MFKINFYQKYALILLILVTALYPNNILACSPIYTSDSARQAYSIKLSLHHRANLIILGEVSKNETLEEEEIGNDKHIVGRIRLENPILEKTNFNVIKIYKNNSSSINQNIEIIHRYNQSDTLLPCAGESYIQNNISFSGAEGVKYFIYLEYDLDQDTYKLIQYMPFKNNRNLTEDNIKEYVRLSNFTKENEYLISATYFYAMNKTLILIIGSGVLISLIIIAIKFYKKQK